MFQCYNSEKHGGFETERSGETANA